MNKSKSLLALVAVSALTAACTTVPTVPPAQATLNYAATADCASAPDLTRAISLTPPKEQATFSVPAPKATGCLTLADGGTTPYVVYALPTDYADKTIIVGSVLEPLRILSPDVAILNRDGEVSRTFDAADYLYRGPVFSVQFRPRETEAYVLVTTDPSRVGQRYDAITVGVVTTTIYTGYGASNWHSGVEANQSRTFSWEGTAYVTVADTDTKEEGGQ